MAASCNRSRQVRDVSIWRGHILEFDSMYTFVAAVGRLLILGRSADGLQRPVDKTPDQESRALGFFLDRF